MLPRNAGIKGKMTRYAEELNLLVDDQSVNRQGFVDDRLGLLNIVIKLKEFSLDKSDDIIKEINTFLDDYKTSYFSELLVSVGAMIPLFSIASGVIPKVQSAVSDLEVMLGLVCVFCVGCIYKACDSVITKYGSRSHEGKCVSTLIKIKTDIEQESPDLTTVERDTRNAGKTHAKAM